MSAVWLCVCCESDLRMYDGALFVLSFRAMEISKYVFVADIFCVPAFNKSYVSAYQALGIASR